MTVERDINEFVKVLGRDIKASTDPRSILRLGTFIIQMIVKRTRSGFGVSKNGGVARKLKALSTSYIQRRKQIKLSGFTNATKSNLTRSGRMLAGLRVKRASTGFLVISPTGRSREGIPNEEVAEHVSIERPFLNLSQRELRQVRDFYVKNLLDINV